MRKISHSHRKPKQGKKGFDCTVHIADVASSEDDMWQVTGHMEDDLDQSKGDMCHHCKGDTWQRLTWQVQWHANVAVWLLTGQTPQ